MDLGIVVIAVVLVFGLGLLFLLNRSSKGGGNRHRGGGMSRAEFRAQWNRVEATLAAPGMDSTKAAILDADKLLDMALKQSGFRGATLGERLKSAREHFKNNATYQGLWEAHKARNALAHELSYEVPKSLGQRYLKQFKDGLEFLRVL